MPKPRMFPSAFHRRALATRRFSAAVLATPAPRDERPDRNECASTRTSRRSARSAVVTTLLLQLRSDGLDRNVDAEGPAADPFGFRIQLLAFLQLRLHPFVRRKELHLHESDRDAPYQRVERPFCHGHPDDGINPDSFSVLRVYRLEIDVHER